MTVASYRTKAVPAVAMEALRAATFEGNTLDLPKLSPADYRKVFAVIDACGGRWDRKTARHVFPGEARSALSEVLGGGKAPAVNPHAYFATPDGTADLVVRKALRGGPATHVTRVLDPSAGEGAMLAAFTRAGGNLGRSWFYEVDRDRATAAAAVCPGGVCIDFLGVLPGEDGPRADLILMNPPFAVVGNPTAYVDHVRHAWDFLIPGGTLAAVTPAGWTFAGVKKLERFREWIEADGLHEPLPADAFPELTVKTVLVLMTKPV